MSDNIHTLGDWITDRALADPQKVAIDDRGVTISYAMLDERITKLADQLIAAGYRNGERIATVAGNSIDMVVVFFACAKAGLVLVPLSWRLTATELAELITRSQASLLLTEDEFATLATEAKKHAGSAVPIVELGSEGIETCVPAPMQDRQTLPAWRAVVDDDPVLLIFTSGSEAAPKGALLSHKNCFWTNLSLGRASNFGSDDIALCMLPQFHVGGWNIYLLLSLWMGATCVLERTFNPTRVLRLIETRGITAIMGVPTQYVMMSKDPLFDEVELSSLRVAQVGGAATPSEIIQRWQDRGVELAPAYGLTEASPNVLYTPAGDPQAGMIPYPNINVRIAGSTEHDAGELQVHGPGVFLGYDGDATRTAAAFTHDGWLRTGDMAERTHGGGFRIVGRSKDIFISGGENVAPAEVERVLAAHPYVDEVAVVGMPDPVWGEVGCAFVVLTPEGLTAHRTAQQPLALAVEIRAHAAKSLAAFKVPARVKFVAELPRISIDKVDRRQLTAEAVAFSEGVQVS